MSHPFSLTLSDLETLECVEDVSHTEATTVQGSLRINLTTYAIGEEGGICPPIIEPPICLPRPVCPPQPICPPIKPPVKPPIEVTTLALGEEGGVVCW